MGKAIESVDGTVLAPSARHAVIGGKPCPFCRSDRLEGRNHPVEGLMVVLVFHQVACLECGAAGPPTLGAGKAVHRWNERE